MSSKNKYTVEFPSKEALRMTLRSLLDAKSLFEMRVQEASDCGATVSAESATNELIVTMQALDSVDDALFKSERKRG